MSDRYTPASEVVSEKDGRDGEIARLWDHIAQRDDQLRSLQRPVVFDTGSEAKAAFESIAPFYPGTSSSLMMGIRGPIPTEYNLAIDKDRAYVNEPDLDRARVVCRHQWLFSPHVRGATSKIVNYTVGRGFNLKLGFGQVESEFDDANDKKRDTSAKKRPIDPRLTQIQAFIDWWYQQMDWKRRRREVIMRYFRDGEVFATDIPHEAMQELPRPLLEIIEPEFIWGNGYLPLQDTGSDAYNARMMFGVVFTPDPGPYRILGYHYQPRSTFGFLPMPATGRFLPVEQVLHIKNPRTVDSSYARGIGFFYPTSKLFELSDSLLLSLAVSGKSRAEIAGIIKTMNAPSSIATAAAMADGSYKDRNGQQVYIKDSGGSKFVFTPEGVDIIFQPNSLAAADFLLVYKQLVRACAVACDMPDLIFSNVTEGANRSNTEHVMDSAYVSLSSFSEEAGEVNSQFLMHALYRGVAMNHELLAGITTEDLADLQIDSQVPPIEVVDATQQAAILDAHVDRKILSRWTAAKEAGHDPEEERKLIEEEQAIFEPVDTQTGADQATVNPNGAQRQGKVNGMRGGQTGNPS